MQFAEGQTTANVSNDGNPWLTIVPSPGGWTVTAASVPSGEYAGSVSVQSGGDRVTVPVRYSVQPPIGGDRAFSVGRSNLTLASTVGGPAASGKVGAFRASWSSRADVTVAYENGAGWLGNGLDEFGNVVLSANPAGLTAGTYRAVATLSSDWPAKPGRVAVTFTVGDGMAVPAPQLLVRDGNVTGTSIAGFFEVRDTLGTRLAWTASTTTPWLRLKSASGTAGSAVEYAIDVAQTDTLPNFADFEARVTINAQSAAGLPLAPVVAGVTLRRDVAEVHTVSPAQIVAGATTEVMVRGRGFDRLSFADLQWVNVTGSVVNQVIRLSDTTLKVTLSPPSAGEIVVTLPNYQGVSISTTTARAFDARALPAAALATGGSARSVLHDAVRRQLFVANTGLGAIQRFRETTAGWAVDKLALADLFDIGFSPDGAWLVATERSGSCTSSTLRLSPSAPATPRPARFIRFRAPATASPSPTTAAPG